MRIKFLAMLLLLNMVAFQAVAADVPWKHSGSLYLLTTPDGANLPATATVNDFPVLVRLHSDFFDFTQAKPHGEDIRFSLPDGKPLAYQIEEWDAKRGQASIWVRIPTISGNQRQEIRVRWGKADAVSESDGQAVFNESNGYLSVWHMADDNNDSVGKLTTKDTGTISTAGMIGQAKRFDGKHGISCGEQITTFPTGSAPHSTECWFRAEKPNATVIAWGNEHAQGKVVMQYRSPPHIRMDCYFSGANVENRGLIPLNEWAHVVHTCEKGNSRIYVNGVLDGESKAAGSPMAIKNPAKMWIGGWYHSYDFVGQIDEVRVSNRVRSAEWIKLQYENQKPLQTLVGPIVTAGKSLELSTAEVSLSEGAKKTFTIKAGGAQKIYWSVNDGGKEIPVAVDRLNYTIDAGRVTGNQSVKLLVKAIYPDGVQTKEVAIKIVEAIPEPQFTLHAPTKWDGRQTIEVVPHISNLAAMKAAGAEQLTYRWNVSDLAVSKDVQPGKLVLTRAQNSGRLTVRASISNGGKETTQTVTLDVKEPPKDAWVHRMPDQSEQPVDGQFYARDDRNEGTLNYNGRLTEAAEAVFLNLYANDKLVNTVTAKPTAELTYALQVKLKPGLIKYKVEFGTKKGDQQTVLKTVSNLVCGDAFIITGQSNAVATDFGKEDPTFRSDWIRTFGSMSGSPKGVSLWGNATHRSRDGEKLQIGYWGMELGRRLVETHQMPIFLINGAVGGTRIDQHQRNHANPEDMTTIYGRLLWRVRQAKLTHGIRGIFWHQGENDQGADGPTGGYGWETYRQLFIELAAAWKQDFPNVSRYYVFQIWPKSCAMGINGSDNRLREVQRNLVTAFSNLSVMSTLGTDPPGGCHFPAAGYAEFARTIAPLVERDFYGVNPTKPITPANLLRAVVQQGQQDELVLEFDQSIKWDATLLDQFYLDGDKTKWLSGRVDGNRLILTAPSPLKGKTITYLDSKAWSQKLLLRGANGLAALTFCEVPIQYPTP